MSIFLAMYFAAPAWLPAFYWLPHFPLTVIIFELIYPYPPIPPYVGYLNNSIPIAWGALVLNIPFYMLVYLYLDEIIPDTYGISKHPCFCLNKKKYIYIQ